MCCCYTYRQPYFIDKNALIPTLLDSTFQLTFFSSVDQGNTQLLVPVFFGLSLDRKGHSNYLKKTKFAVLDILLNMWVDKEPWCFNESLKASDMTLLSSATKARTSLLSENHVDSSSTTSSMSM